MGGLPGSGLVRNQLTWCHLVVVVVVLSMLLASAGLTIDKVAANTASPNRYYAIYLGHGDYFVNYDHTQANFGRTIVDQAVDFLYYRGATRSGIKEYLRAAGYRAPGSDQYGAVNDGPQTNSVWQFDVDGGNKTNLCSSNDNYTRIYTTPGGAGYNIDFGFWVIGSAHRDQYECGGGTRRFGYGENAENQLAAALRNDSRLRVFEDWASFSNQEPDRLEGDQFWRNNGLATYVDVVAP